MRFHTPDYWDKIDVRLRPPIGQRRARFELLTARAFWCARIGRTVIVPKGFVTDFASVPWFAWPLLPPLGSYAPAALLHDYVYFLKGRLTESVILSRKEADILFRDIMIDLGVGGITRRMIYGAVRMGGRSIWKRRPPHWKYRKTSNNEQARIATIYEEPS